ncbi:acyclic terpene utilization AtuA family protein [Variovorax sp. J22R133]|uniref:acyclic terpene utilization AtuA family protein n=1 Tax=Variovorax brevis TaxID=3053503 RepID=UPI0025768A92|nr:acyclic terpene utilization AtuA family protein [Variovorax sp. J22R133]MDM0116477.1 acyclic terpene utilization AtuA family protein [Variovorax sp. J22R133]
MSTPATSTSPNRVVRIGGASGFWGDSSDGPRQLVRDGQIDYLVFDYLAETTMAVLAAARLRKPAMGYATDFVDIAMRDVLADAMAKGIRIVSNAGGINPEACAEALRALAAELGVEVRIAVVTGDDVSARMPALREAGVRDMYSGEALPERVVSASAYLGALAVRDALAGGAQVVITGRCVDSAVTLGPLMHEFGWAQDDWDRLAGGSLAGHIIECGCQATGGLHTDWQDIPDWPHIGYPIALCREDGSFSITKPAGTGGRILRAAIAEQLLYEIGDPGAYALPDVVCDFREVRIEQEDEAHVRVHGARGRPPGPAYKVSATAQDGWRCAGSMVIVGMDAAAKARRTAQAILDRTRRLFAERGLPDYSATHVEVLGTEVLYGPRARTRDSREVMMRVVVDHASRSALEIFAREVAPAGTSWSPGTTGPGGGRPAVSPLVKPFSFLIDKASVDVQMSIDGETRKVVVPSSGASTTPAPLPEPAALSWPAGTAMREVRLIDLAWARSGDKGDVSNIGLVARRAEWLPLLWQLVTPEVVKAWFTHLVHGEVERFHLPGIAGMNLVLHQALAGGGPRSPRLDPLGKGMAQMLLEMPLSVPSDSVWD